MKKRIPRPVRIPSLVQKEVIKLKKEESVLPVAKPLREALIMLQKGEIWEVDGNPVVKVPAAYGLSSDWLPISTMIYVWREYWAMLDPKVDLTRLNVVADRLNQDKEITPRLAEAALEEFNQSVEILGNIPHTTILKVLNTLETRWLMETFE